MMLKVLAIRPAAHHAVGAATVVEPPERTTDDEEPRQLEGVALRMRSIEESRGGDEGPPTSGPSAAY